MTLQGKSINLDVKRVIGYRQFCNKIWNTVRFALNLFTPEFKLTSILELKEKEQNLSLSDKWILNKLSLTIESMDKCFTEYNFSELAIVF